LEFRIENRESTEKGGGGVGFWGLVRGEDSVVLAIGRFHAGGHRGGAPHRGFHRVPVWLRVENGLAAYLIYLRQMVVPTDWRVPYPYAPREALLRQAGLAVVVLAGASAWVWARRKKRPYALVGWLWFLGMLVPMIEFGANLLLFARGPLHVFAGNRAGHRGDVGGGGMDGGVETWAGGDGGLTVVVIGALDEFARTGQTGYWKDSVTLWKRALAQTSGNTLASYNLGEALHKAGRWRSRPDISKTLWKWPPTITRPSAAWASC